MDKWTLVCLLWLVCFFNYADRQAIYSVFPLLKTEMGLTDVQLGVVGASFMWVYAAARRGGGRAPGGERRPDQRGWLDRRRVRGGGDRHRRAALRHERALSASSVIYLVVGMLLLFGRWIS